MILPLYGCLGQLPAHLQSLHSLSTIVHEFIWVIQEGPNGSQQLAKEAACRLGGQIIEAPKGLHHAWNQGVSLATGPYTYFSTIGDFISVQDLANLIICLEQTGAHGVFSPPGFGLPQGEIFGNVPIGQYFYSQRFFLEDLPASYPEKCPWLCRFFPVVPAF